VVLRDPVESVALPPEAVAFDHGAVLAWATDRAFHVPSDGGGPSEHPVAFPLARQPGAAPLRVPFLVSPGSAVAPGADSARIVDRRTGRAADLGLQPLVSRDRGYGLTGQVVDDLVVPHVLGFEAGGRLVLLLGGPRGFTRLVDGRRTPLPEVEIDEGARLEGFEHVVPPLLADLDRDGVPDLVRVDVVRGAVAIQGGLDRDPIPPPRVILLKAPVLAAAAADMTGDGAPELVVLRIPTLTPLQQLAILMESKVSATVLAYDLSARDGGAPAPSASTDVPVGVDIVVGEQVRRAEIRDLVAFGNGKVLVATPGSRARAYPAGGGRPVELGPVPAGRWTDPLRPARAGRAVFGVLRSDDGARVVRLPLD
jgi:hypothetical protein